MSTSFSLYRYTRLQWLPAGCRCVCCSVLLSSLAINMNICIADRTIKSQGVPLAELSVSPIGWLFVIDGAWPTGQPSKSIQTAGKDEMAVGTWAAGACHTHTHTPYLNGYPLFRTPSIS